METKTCIYCKKEFSKPKFGEKGYTSWQQWNKHKFCSVQCATKVFPPPKRGFKIKRICKYCKKEFWIGKGELKWHKMIYCSKKCEGKDHRKEKHWNWKGGITDINRRIRNSRKYINWRIAVYKRDKWTCQICKIKCKKGNIIAHHIKNFNDYPKLRFEVDNGITFCRVCHKKYKHNNIGLKTRFQL